MTDESEEIVEKEVSESKTALNDTMNNIRYDVIRNLINTLFTTYTNNLNDIVTHSLKDLTFGQTIAFNTLFAKNIIKEVKINE